MTAVSGQLLENLTKKTLKKIRTNQSFDHFYANVAHKPWRPGGQTNAFKKTTHSGQTEGWCWCTKPSPNCQRSLSGGSIMRLFILSSVLSISPLIRKASAPTPRWKPSSVVKAANGDDYEVSWSIIQRRCWWYRGSVGATKYFGSYVKGGEDIMFWLNPVDGVKSFENQKRS